MGNKKLLSDVLAAYAVFAESPTLNFSKEGILAARKAAEKEATSYQRDHEQRSAIVEAGEYVYLATLAIFGRGAVSAKRSEIYRALLKEFGFVEGSNPEYGTIYFCMGSVAIAAREYIGKSSNFAQPAD
jgi:hypothetical protein